jgi:hypothetical protein
LQSFHFHFRSKISFLVEFNSVPSVVKKHSTMSHRLGFVKIEDVELDSFENMHWHLPWQFNTKTILVCNSLETIQHCMDTFKDTPCVEVYDMSKKM